VSGSVCKGCGKPIRFAKNLAGKYIPLDERAPVYEIVKVLGEERAQLTERAFVTHFATCAKANDFSKKKEAT
jgi:hypothetical protein